MIRMMIGMVQGFPARGKIVDEVETRASGKGAVNKLPAIL